MSKIKTVLSVKGLRSPRSFIWLRGFLHGKVIHTGGLDPETGIISSGYVTGQTKRFHNACVARREQAEVKLTKAWADADQLLIDLAAVSSALADSGKSQNPHIESSAQARANERVAELYASREAERQSILKSLASIANGIRAEFNFAHDQMEATAEALLSTFSCYGHGLLMKPIYTRNLPAINYEDCAKQILTGHEDIWNAIISTLKEVKE